MFYTMFVLVFGVFIGQEYTNLPSVKNSWNKMVTYFNDHSVTGSPEHQHSGNNANSILDFNKIGSFLKSFITENVNTEAYKKKE